MHQGMPTERAHILKGLRCLAIALSKALCLCVLSMTLPAQSSGPPLPG